MQLLLLGTWNLVQENQQKHVYTVWGDHPEGCISGMGCVKRFSVMLSFKVNNETSWVLLYGKSLDIHTVSGPKF